MMHQSATTPSSSPHGTFHVLCMPLDIDRFTAESDTEGRIESIDEDDTCGGHGWALAP